MSQLARLASAIDQLGDALIVVSSLAAIALVSISALGDGAPDAWREVSNQMLIAIAYLVAAGVLTGLSIVLGFGAALHRASRALLAVAVTLMVLLTVLIVGLRYGAGLGTIGLQEGVIYLHGAMFLLGIPYALRHDAHVRVDLLYSTMPARRKAAVNLLGHVVFLIPVALVLMTLSLPYVENAWRVVEGSAEVGGVPAVFVLKTLIPIAGFVLLVQGLAESLKALAVLTNKSISEASAR